MTRVPQWLTCALLALTSAPSAWAGQGGSDLVKLTVPASQLPAGCRLMPGPRGFVKTNPAVITDPQTLGFMYGLLFGPLPASQSPDLVALGARVAAGYAAAYEEKGGSHEIGVYALRVKDPAQASGRPRVNAPRSTLVVKGSVVIFSWTDILPGQKDLGCSDVVRRHIDQVQLK
jgi:hypothetical protein